MYNYNDTESQFFRIKSSCKKNKAIKYLPICIYKWRSPKVEKELKGRRVIIISHYGRQLHVTRCTELGLLLIALHISIPQPYNIRLYMQKLAGERKAEGNKVEDEEEKIRCDYQALRNSTQRVMQLYTYTTYVFYS